MSPRPTRVIESSLTSKGFVEVKGKDHKTFQLYVNREKKDIFTFYSHGADECDDRILGKMARQVKLSRKQFDALIDCNMSGEDYIKALEYKGYVF